MLETLFSPIFSETFTISAYLICTLVSLALGAVIAWATGFRSRQTKSFMLSLLLLPPIVQTVIMLVNGSVGTAVAVMGAFSLVRFRSAPGSAKEITIPESLNYAHEFDDLFAQYTKSAKLQNVKTTNMGSLYKLIYRVEIKQEDDIQKFIDELRCRNGNLEIAVLIPTLDERAL